MKISFPRHTFYVASINPFVCYNPQMQGTTQALVAMFEGGFSRQTVIQLFPKCTSVQAKPPTYTGVRRKGNLHHHHMVMVKVAGIKIEKNPSPISTLCWDIKNLKFFEESTQT